MKSTEKQALKKNLSFPFSWYSYIGILAILISHCISSRHLYSGLSERLKYTNIAKYCWSISTAFNEILSLEGTLRNEKNWSKIFYPIVLKPELSFGRRALPFLSLGIVSGVRLLSQSLKVLKTIFSDTYECTGPEGVIFWFAALLICLTFSSSFTITLPFRRLFNRLSPERITSDLKGLDYGMTV